MDEQGYDDFFNAHHRTVHRALVLAGCSPAVAADVAQEAFVRAYERWRRVRLMERPQAWVFRVAFNHRARTAGREARAVPTGLVPAALVDCGSVERIDLRDALGRLPERQRTVFTLCHIADQTTAEISHALGVSEATVRVHLFRAVRKLRRLLGAAETVTRGGAVR